MTIENDIMVLEQVPMLRALGRSALRLIALGAESRELAPGDMLFKPGERIDSAYVVQDGVFHLIAGKGVPGRPVEVGPGTMLGEFALLADASQPLCAEAQVYSTVIRVSRSMFLKILEDDANAAMRLRDYIEHRVHQSIDDVLRVRQALDPGES